MLTAAIVSIPSLEATGPRFSATATVSQSSVRNENISRNPYASKTSNPGKSSTPSRRGLDIFKVTDDVYNTRKLVYY